MRTLMLSFAVFSSPCVALAAAPQAKISTQVKSERGATGASTAGVASASTVTMSTDLNSGSALGALALRAGYDRIQPARERTLLTDRQGNVRPLSELYNGPEHSARAGLDVNLPGASISLDGSQTMGRTAYPGHTAALQSSFDRYETGTRVLAGLSRSDFASPRSYFVDPDTFRTRERPGRLLEEQAELGVEQILSERMKGRVQVSYARRPDRRPPKRGLEGSVAWAFHDDKSLVATVGSARELRSSALHDDRGYLDATWFQAEVRWEPAYAWRVFGRVGTIFETESPRGRLARQRVGTDSLGAEVRRAGGRIEFGVSSLAAFSNNGYRALQIGGNLTWLL